MQGEGSKICAINCLTMYKTSNSGRLESSSTLQWDFQISEQDYIPPRIKLLNTNVCSHRSQWPRNLRRGSVAARLLRFWLRIPPGAWMDVCCECCVLSGGGLCDEQLTRPEESYRLWCVVVCDLEASWMRRLWPTGGCRAKNNQWLQSVSGSRRCRSRERIFRKITVCVHSLQHLRSLICS